MTTESTAEHFPGCHPEDAEAPASSGPAQRGAPEGCWHCGTITSMGCDCRDCYEGGDDVPPEAAYHCPTCKRWWSYMSLNVTTISW